MTNQEAFAWVQEFPGAVTVCDRDGIILAMNDKSVRTFESDGGAALIGSSLFGCHPEPSLTKVRELLAAERPNIYTIEKNGIKKLIYQSPWYKEGVYSGFVELSLEIPFEMQHFVRSV
jgi:hypothetical protein